MITRRQKALLLSRRKIPEAVKQRARTAVAMALLRGDLVRKPCEQCGDPKTDAHHDNYSWHMVVRWLCRSCHQKHHGRLPWSEATKAKARKTRAIWGPVWAARRAEVAKELARLSKGKK